MSTPIQVWLQAADALFGQTDVAHEVDALVEEGLSLDTSDATGVDPVQLERVMAVLRARAAAMATEIGDLTRQRISLTRARAGASGYLSAT
jgi:hypothetical protein